jgi:hypothetical protein
MPKEEIGTQKASLESVEQSSISTKDPESGSDTNSIGSYYGCWNSMVGNPSEAKGTSGGFEHTGCAIC